MKTHSPIGKISYFAISQNYCEPREAAPARVLGVISLNSLISQSLHKQPPSTMLEPPRSLTHYQLPLYRYIYIANI